MTPRTLSYAALLALLAGLNAWYWWPAAPPGAGALADLEAGDRVHGAFRPEDFQVPRREAGAPKASPGGRDPFRTASEQAAHPARPTEPQPTAAEAARAGEDSRRRAAQQVTAERSAAREALGRFKVAGILVSDGRQQAFLVSDEGTYLVQAGDTVAERYRVAEITLDAVRLTDTDTQVSTFIPIAGN